MQLLNSVDSGDRQGVGILSKAVGGGTVVYNPIVPWLVLDGGLGVHGIMRKNTHTRRKTSARRRYIKISFCSVSCVSFF